MESTQVYDAAMMLPDESRAELAYRLLQSLKPPGALSEDLPGFEAELDRRVRAYEAGETTADDWPRVSRRLREALEARKRP